MTLLLQLLPAVLLWLAVAYRLPSFWRTPRDAGRRGLWLTLLFLALAVTVLFPPVFLALDTTLGVPNFSRLLSNSLTLVSCWTVQEFLAHLSGTSDGRVIRRNGLFLVVALVLMAGLFLTARLPREALNFPEDYGTAPQILAYRLVYLLYVALTEITVARLSWQYAHVASAPSLRLGLRLVAAGGVAGLIYVVQDLTTLALQRLDVSYPLTNLVRIHEILVACAVVLGAVGATMPSWGPHVGIPRFHRWVVSYRSLRRLYPLWRVLYEANPNIAFLPPVSSVADVMNVRDVDFRLFRRVVEIRDGILLLRPYSDPQVRERVAQLAREAGIDDDIEPLVVAASIVAGRMAKLSGHDIWPVDSQLPKMEGVDLEREVSALERIASYLRSPIAKAACEPANAKESVADSSQLRGSGSS